MRQPKALEEENAKLKRLLADALLDASVLKDLLEKTVTPAARSCRARAGHGRRLPDRRRACSIVGADRSTTRYRSRRNDDALLRDRLRELATERRRFGYRRLHVLLRLEGHVVNHKRTQRPTVAHPAQQRQTDPRTRASAG